MPRFASMTLHIHEPTLVHGVSTRELVMSSVVSRKIEAMQTLFEISRVIEQMHQSQEKERKGLKYTYTSPMAKTQHNATFFFAGRFNLLITGTGSTIITKSLAMLNVALANQNATRLMHVPSGSAFLKANATGAH